MNSIELTERLVTDLKNALALRASGEEKETVRLNNLDKHLGLAIQLINFDTRPLLTYSEGVPINLALLLEELTEKKESVIGRVQKFIDEDPFVSLPDNQSLSGELTRQLDLIHTAAGELPYN